MKTKICSICGEKVIQMRKPMVCRKCYRKYINSKKDKKWEYLDEDIPNKFPRSFFQNIDSEIKAYILGWIASNGHIDDSGFAISINRRDIGILYDIESAICSATPITSWKDDKINICFNSKQICEDLCKHLSIPSRKEIGFIKFPNLSDDFLRWAFVRGFFDGDGDVSDTHFKKNNLKCTIKNDSKNIINDIYKFVSIPGCLGENIIEWSGNSALDFLGKIYDNASIKLLRKFELYIDWSLWQPGLDSNGVYGRSDEFRWVKTDKRAVGPTKNRVSDAGYDLTIIKKVKSVGDVEFYDTGIKIQPDFGYYFDLVPRSSISKTGYMLANSIGVIDRTYIGPVLVALRKVDKSAPDLELPCKIVQIVPRHIVHLQIKEVDELSDTERGERGFGSSGER